jgi:SUN domain-containing protein 1/2
MSFSGTPLGQGRRLDHHSFLNKPQSSGRPLSTNSSAAYSYGSVRSLSPPRNPNMTRLHHHRAPLGSRSPQKPASSTRDRTLQTLNNADDSTREDPRPPTSHGPKVITSPPDPSNWVVKDTSVLIASAFNQAAKDMHPNDPNNSWASGRNASGIPRSTSVEYEQVTVHPRRTAAPRSVAGRKPASKQKSLRHVPDSEGEDDSIEHSRAKSPYEQVVDVAKRALGPATFYLRQRTPESEHPTANGTNGSYDYSAEEREYHNIMSNGSRRLTAAQKRNRISIDNKAYQPSQSDLEESDEDPNGDGRKIKKKKKKKEPLGGPLTSLPVAGYDKKKKKRVRKGAAGAQVNMLSQEVVAAQRASVARSVPPSRTGPTPVLHPPPDHVDTTGDISMDVEQGLHSIPEIPEIDEPEPLPPKRRSRSVERQHKRPFSIGGALGKMVHTSYTTLSTGLVYFWRCISAIFFILGRILGYFLDLAFVAPLRWLSGTTAAPFVTLGKYLTIACILYAAWYLLRDPSVTWSLPQFPFGSGPYQAPGIPAANVAELSIRLQRLENALSELSQTTVRSNTRFDTTAKTHDDLKARLGSLESRVSKESVRAAEAEKEVRSVANQGLEVVKREVEVLHAQIQSHQPPAPNGALSDEEARAKLKALEERVGSMEGGVREALEMGKSVGKAGAGAAWWKMFASGGSKHELTVRSSDGQDVTSLIGHLVESAVSRHGKDMLARPDFALHSGGAMVIPSLTSPTFEVKPQNLRGQVVGFLTGNGHAIGRPPVTALHHELHNGHCWPFAGSEGQLGVVLAAPTYVTEVTIDHVAKEVAFDMRSAPREMELWGMVEGKDNVARVKAWHNDRALMRKQLEAQGEEVLEELKEVPYPRTLPKSPQYVRLAKFTYDIRDPHNVQTFPVAQEIRDLDVDFGIVVLLVKSNWGRQEFTCLYRLRVHGQRMGETPLPYAEDEIA